MNAKRVALLVVLIIVCIIIPNVCGIESNEWINNQLQSVNSVVHEPQPEIQNFISAPDALVELNALNDTSIDYQNTQFYPYPLSVNNVAKNNVANQNETAVENISRRPPFTTGFQMLRRSVATMVERIQYFIQSIWNYFTVDTSMVEARHGHGHHKKKFKIKKKYKKYLLPLLIAYKLKFFTLVPVIISGLMLLAGSTGMAGFFFALFTAVITLKHKESSGH
ncbi:hypothetical protein Bhyg_10257 [Pseudolycoriella hygida]|uniref:Uncharacterized protein n=1 Tax=Pseudolycoriella hygida TaxID=35572 RepID=A0A9Q0MT64_9DIPT|nr:hypothetical protein Bhyg_10257 [Pseudolycoriella hygida]